MVASPVLCVYVCVSVLMHCCLVIFFVFLLFFFCFVYYNSTHGRFKKASYSCELAVLLHFALPSFRSSSPTPTISSFFLSVFRTYACFYFFEQFLNFRRKQKLNTETENPERGVFSLVSFFVLTVSERVKEIS